MYAISVANLSYSHNSFSPPALRDITLHLPPGSRTILIGANGGVMDTSPVYPSLIFFSWQIHLASIIGGQKACHFFRR